LEAVEGSLVGVESQPGAGAKSINADDKEEPATKDKKDDSKAKTHCKPTAKDDKGPDNKGDKRMKMEIKALEISQEIDSENLETSLQEFQKTIDDKVAEIQEAADLALTEMTAECDGYKAVYPEPGKAEELNSQAEDGKKYKAFLIDEIVKFQSLLGLLEADKVDGKKETLAKMNIDELTAELETFVKKWNEDHPVTAQTKDNDDTEVNEMPENMFRFIAPVK